MTATLESARSDRDRLATQYRAAKQAQRDELYVDLRDMVAGMKNDLLDDLIDAGGRCD